MRGSRHRHRAHPRDDHRVRGAELLAGALADRAVHVRRGAARACRRGCDSLRSGVRDPARHERIGRAACGTPCCRCSRSRSIGAAGIARYARTSAVRAAPAAVGAHRRREGRSRARRACAARARERAARRCSFSSRSRCRACSRDRCSSRRCSDGRASGRLMVTRHLRARLSGRRGRDGRIRGDGDPREPRRAISRCRWSIRGGARDRVLAQRCDGRRARRCSCCSRSRSARYSSPRSRARIRSRSATRSRCGCSRRCRSTHGDHFHLLGTDRLRARPVRARDARGAAVARSGHRRLGARGRRRHRDRRDRRLEGRRDRSRAHGGGRRAARDSAAHHPARLRRALAARARRW